MEAKEIDFAKLNEAVEKFGSLQKANAQLEKDKLALEKKKTQLKQENDILSVAGDKLASLIVNMNNKVKSYQSQLQSLANQIKLHSYQYELFCGFMAMVAESPSVTDSINTLIGSFQKLKEPGWTLPKNADEMRSLFVRTVMGDYLKCFCCKACGAKFIVNNEPHYKSISNYYQCPSCYTSHGIKPEDSFLKAMVSEQQLRDAQHLEKVLEQYEVLEPFKAFLKVPCEICHEPVKEWDDYNVKLAIEGTGCGHTQCWNSKAGQLKELKKAIEKFNKS